MTVANFITLFMQAGNESVSATTAKLLKKKFKQVLHEDVLTLGNDTVLSYEFNTTWIKIHEFVKKQKPQPC